MLSTKGKRPIFHRERECVCDVGNPGWESCLCLSLPLLLSIELWCFVSCCGLLACVSLSVCVSLWVGCWSCFCVEGSALWIASERLIGDLCVCVCVCVRVRALLQNTSAPFSRHHVLQGHHQNADREAVPLGCEPGRKGPSVCVPVCMFHTLTRKLCPQHECIPNVGTVQ